MISVFDIWISVMIISTQQRNIAQQCANINTATQINTNIHKILQHKYATQIYTNIAAEININTQHKDIQKIAT